MLAVPGVVLTTLIVGVTAHFAFDLPWDMAFLVGAVLSPTDPAILIPLFVRSRLKPKLAQTVIAESAFNDPTGAALALTLAGVVLTGSHSVADPASDFLVDLGISTVIGIVAGVVLAAAISSDRSGIWRESAPLAVLSVVTISFFSLDTAGGSGYLGAFLAGLIVGNMEHLGLGEGEHAAHRRRAPVRLSSRGPGDADHLHGARREHPLQRAGRQPAAGARGARDADARRAHPITVAVCALPDRGARAGPATSWPSSAGRAETGVVPAALVGVLAGLGVPDGDVFASVVALAIVLHAAPTGAARSLARGPPGPAGAPNAAGCAESGSRLAQKSCR